MTQISDKLRQLALALRDARLTIDPYDQEYASETIDAVASDLEALSHQLDASRTYLEARSKEVTDDDAV